MREVRIDIDDLPISKNNNWARGNFRNRAQAKKAWERLLMDRFREVGLPRPIPQTYPSIVPVEVFVVIRARRRINEPENWRPFISEVMGDALIGGHRNYRKGERKTHDGWIYDDTKQYWNFNFATSDTYGPVLTAIKIMWLEGEVKVIEQKDDSKKKIERPIGEHYKYYTRGPIFDANPHARIEHPKTGKECVRVSCPPHKREIEVREMSNDSTREEDDHEEQVD